MSRKTFSPVIAETCTALIAGTVVVSPANAVGCRSGYIECNPNRQVAVTSYTTKNVDRFTVGHIVAGTPNRSWNTGGYNTSRHDTPGGNWAASTNGTMRSAGASCA